MPLSEHEQHLLEQIERQLVAEDPKFASSVRAVDPRRHSRRRIAVAAVVAVVGLALVCVGIILGRPLLLGVPIIAAVGFLAMFFGLVFGLTAYRGRRADGGKSAGGAGGSKGTSSPGRSSMADRLEERWRRRSEGER